MQPDVTQAKALLVILLRLVLVLILVFAGGGARLLARLRQRRQALLHRSASR